MKLKELLTEDKTINLSGIRQVFNVNVRDGMIESEALKNALKQYSVTLTSDVESKLMSLGDSAIKAAIKEIKA